MGIEIEKKFTVKHLPEDIEKYPFHEIEQGYLNVFPAIRVRREDERYYMTYKASKERFVDCGLGEEYGINEGDIGNIEFNLPLDKENYIHLAKKADGNVIRKKRYLLPLNEDAFEKGFLADNPELSEAIAKGEIKIELDVFKAPFEGRILAEVEFPSEEAARNYNPAEWFDEDVTGDRRFSNSQMTMEKV